jgi:hypothetical protein
MLQQSLLIVSPKAYAKLIRAIIPGPSLVVVHKKKKKELQEKEGSCGDGGYTHGSSAELFKSRCFALASVTTLDTLNQVLNIPLSSYSRWGSRTFKNLHHSKLTLKWETLFDSNIQGGIYASPYAKTSALSTLSWLRRKQNEQKYHLRKPSFFTSILPNVFI